jgi:hypothetical protein
MMKPYVAWTMSKNVVGLPFNVNLTGSRTLRRTELLAQQMLFVAQPRHYAQLLNVLKA